MKTKLFLLYAICVIALAACATPMSTATPVPPPPTPVPPPDPASQIKVLVDLLNAGNVDAVIAFFTDDATQTQTPPPSGTSGIRTGKDQIRGFYKGLIDDHFSVELSNVKAAGDKVTYTCTFSTDSYKKIGVAPLVTMEEAVFVGGKIKSQTINVSPESLAKIQAAIAAAQAKAAPTPTAALKPSDAALEQELVIYSASQVLAFAAKAFQDKAGIKVSTVYLPSGGILQRIDAEKERPLGDVVWDVGFDTVGSRPDLFEPYKLKEVDQLCSEVDKSSLTVPANLGASATIIYNKKLVPVADAPKQWVDLLDPKWKGKIVAADPSLNSSAYSSLVTRLIAFKDKGWEFEEKLIQNMVIVNYAIQIPPKINVGEYAVGLVYEEAAYIYARGENATVGVVYPSDGTGISYSVGALIKGAKHPNAAKAFLDFSVSAEFQKAYVNQSYGTHAVRSDVPSPAGLPALQVIKTIEYDQKWAADNRDANLKKYKDLRVKYNK